MKDDLRTYLQRAREALLWKLEQSIDDITGLYRRVWTHSDATIEALPLDAHGQVPWWPAEHADVTLHRVLVHMIAETERHARHADIVREMIDGSAGIREGSSNIPNGGDGAWWASYYERVEAAACQAADAPAQES